MAKEKKEAEIVYNQIADKYKQSKILPFRIHVEKYSFFKLLGDMNHKNVLDLACGEGIYTREIKNRGAEIVYGVDISPKMIELAQSEEEKTNLGIKYKVMDVATMGKIQPFDIVCATYLLNYARTKDQLVAFVQSIYDNLKPEGRFVSINDNVAQPVELYSLMRTYGFVKSSVSTRQEGDAVTYTFLDEQGNDDFSFNNYYLKPETYQSVFREIGFSSFRWIAPQLSPEESIRNNKDGFWDDFFKIPPIIGIEAVK